MELLERGQFLQSLLDCPPGRVVLVSGEAGIGKTSLMKAWCAVTGRRVLWGSCDALRTPRPLGPLHDIARQAGGQLAAAVGAGDARQAMFGAFLDELADRSAVAVLDDVHWADEATLDLLLYAVRRISLTPSVLALAYRENEVVSGHPLLRVLGALAADSGVLRVRLPPLSVPAVAALAAGAGLAAPGGIDATELHARTGGNPFFVTEALADPEPAVPATVRDAVLARAAALSPAERDALESVAIFPGGVAVAMIMAGRGDVDRCVRAGMLIADGTRMAFRHELARLAIATSIPPARKITLHEAALRVLISHGAEPAQLAYHAEEAGDAAAVLRYAPEAAGRARAVAAYRQAADHYAQALRYAPALPARSRAELLEAYAEVRDAVGDGDGAALAASAQALACWREAGDPAREAALMARRAHYLWRSGDNAAAHATAREAVVYAERLPPGPALAAAYTWSAYLMMLARDVSGAIAIGERATELADEFGPEGLLARALNAVGTARWFSDPELAEQTLARSVRVAQDAGDAVAAGWALVNLGSGAGEIRRYQTAERWLREAIDWCSARDLDTGRNYATAWLARCLFERGAWPEAASTLAGISAQDASAPTRIVELAVLGRLRARRGDAGAAGALDEAWELAERTGDLQRLWPVAAGRAELAWLSGRPAAEIAALVRPVHALAVRLDHPWAIGELGQWLGDDDDRPGAAGAPRIPEPYLLPPVEAARAWDDLGCPYEAASALAASSSAEALAEALRRFEQLGARPAADQTARRLRDLGIRTRRRSTLVHQDGLTARQADVLALLREGLGNKEIAERLSVSPKTVDHHVSAILAKLGVRSRQEAARHAQNGEPATPR